jgi:hypothetical protein
MVRLSSGCWVRRAAAGGVEQGGDGDVGGGHGGGDRIEDGIGAAREELRVGVAVRVGGRRDEVDDAAGELEESARVERRDDQRERFALRLGGTMVWIGARRVALLHGVREEDAADRFRAASS